MSAAIIASAHTPNTARIKLAELADQQGGEGGAAPYRHTELQQMLAQKQVRLATRLHATGRL